MHHFQKDSAYTLQAKKRARLQNILKVGHSYSLDWSLLKRKHMPWFVGVDVELWCCISSGADLVNRHGKHCMGLWAYILTHHKFTHSTAQEHWSWTTYNSLEFGKISLNLVKSWLQPAHQAGPMLFSVASCSHSPHSPFHACWAQHWPSRGNDKLRERESSELYRKRCMRMFTHMYTHTLFQIWAWKSPVLKGGSLLTALYTHLIP